MATLLRCFLRRGRATQRRRYVEDDGEWRDMPARYVWWCYHNIATDENAGDEDYLRITLPAITSLLRESPPASNIALLLFSRHQATVAVAAALICRHYAE